MKKGGSFLKKVLILCAGLVLIAALGFAGGSKESTSAKADIIIGVSTAITGPAPLEGERTKQGLALAEEEINNAGGVLGRKIKLVIEDDQNTVNVAVNSVNKLLSQDVVALIGPHRSNCAMAVQQTVAKEKIAYLTGGTSPKLTALKNPYLFRVRASDGLVAKIAAKFAMEELKAKNIGILFNNDEYGTGARDVIMDFGKANGLTIVAEGHNTGDKDMTGQVLKMKNGNVDSIIVWTHVPESAIIVRQLKELNVKAPVVGGPTFTNQAFLGLAAAPEIEGCFSTTDFADDNPDAKVQAFVTKFKSRYGNAVPETFSSTYYDALYLVVDAIKRAGSTDREAVRKALVETKSLQGVMSNNWANASNEMIHEAVIAQIKDKKPRLMKIVKE